MSSVFGDNVFLSDNPIMHHCDLYLGEVIIEVRTYETMAWGAFKVQGGITFITNKKTCGPYGVESAIMSVVTGGKLLYVYGLMGSHFDYFNFVFYQC